MQFSLGAYVMPNVNRPTNLFVHTLRTQMRAQGFPHPYDLVSDTTVNRTLGLLHHEQYWHVCAAITERTRHEAKQQ